MTHNKILPWQYINALSAIKSIELEQNITLAPSQHVALKAALNSKLLVITGGPGVGKTTIMRSLVAILSARKVKILLCAPTGRAAKRLSETTGLQAKTIHRLLEINPASGVYGFNQERPLKCDLLVLDEASIIDIHLMSALLKALPEQDALLLVGDVDQLPSVGPGQVLSDMINSDLIPVVRLTEVFRQAAQSAIIANAHKINNYVMPDIHKLNYPGSDFFFIEKKTPEESIATIKQLVKYAIPQRLNIDPVKDIQILCPSNRGSLGANAINTELQQILNISQTSKVERFGRAYMLGDKVMQIQNDYDRDVFNGDIGFIQQIDYASTTMIVLFDDRAVKYDFSELDQLVLAYASTIHKSQGSEYPVVIISLSMQTAVMLQKNLVYTAITRGKQLVIIVGEVRALELATKPHMQTKRLTRLKAWLELE